MAADNRQVQSDPYRGVPEGDQVGGNYGDRLARHISIDKAVALGLKVTALESDQRLQELVLTVHHACIQTLTETPALKIIENHMGVAFISSLQTVSLTR